MLSLGRYPGQKIIITCPDGTILTICVSRIMPDHLVKLGINAPLEYRVDREEIDERRKRDEYIKRANERDSYYRQNSELEHDIYKELVEG